MHCLQIIVSAAILYTAQCQRKCQNLPAGPPNGQNTWWVGGWRYFTESVLTINIQENGDFEGGNFDGSTCEEVIITKNHSATSAFVWGNMILKKTTGGSTCYGCVLLEQRTPNVIEFKQSDCSSSSRDMAKGRCESVASGGTFIQLFRADQLPINCKNTMEGTFHFTYEQQANEGICNNPENRIEACQRPGSAYKDNQVFLQEFKKCPGNAGSVEWRREYICLGSWRDPEDPHKQYSAITLDDQSLFEEKVRCILTKDNQQLENNDQRYTMSSKPTCNELQDEREGPWRIVRTPAITPTQMDQLQPSCMLPQNFSGTWFTSSEYDSDVSINSTHIHFNTRYTSFQTVDTYFTCQQTRDTRFLMKQVTQGRCEVDYVCFEFLPRHQNIIRFRMGKPYRDDPEKYSRTTEGMQEIFSLACSWSAFTVSRTENLNYVYQTFILNPPAPVECPIGGIYNFTQTGVKQFKYQTKIRGVTERPRVGYICDNVESEFKVCSFNPKTIFLDTDRCATVDHVGRPIGEYDEPDNFLQCVGYWQENQQSYLVTHDTEDPVAPFRCWVYERLGWKDIRMSRALRAACGPSQTPRSYTDAEGASLQLELHENEREFDDCPQRFLDGRDPYMQSTMVYILSSASISSSNIILTNCIIFFTIAKAFASW